MDESPVDESRDTRLSMKYRPQEALFKRVGGLLCLLTVALWQPGVEAADAGTSRGAAVAQTCVTCHGPEGQSQGAIPSLATLASADMRAALQAFRAETRQSTVMHRIAKGLNDDDIAAVAAYFAAQPRP